jgi:3-oxoacyl-[acyl-carrier protein] reductase
VNDKRVAIVTGAAGGIGEGIARRLVEAGCAVALVDIDAGGCDAAVARLGGASEAIAVQADVSDPQAVAHAVDLVASRLGTPTILVNNAGFARDVPFDQMSVEQWDLVQGVHLRGAFLMARAVVPYMKELGWGRIVNISSISARGHSERANYCAAKAGMEGLVRALAVELGPFGITANAVAPGLVVTAMTSATAARRGLSLEDHLADAVTRIPARRAGTPGDVAHAVAYFASEEAGFVSGQVLTVSGGVIV